MARDTIIHTIPTDAAALQALAETYRELPAMPKAVADTLRKLAAPEWSIEEVEATISNDPALVARMISVSNSALYGGDHEFRTLNQALVRLGFRAIRSLVVVAAARALFPMDDTRTGQWGRELWMHSAECGWAARMVAEAVGQKDPDDAFAAGVLHDVGKVVILLNRPDDYQRSLDLMEERELDSVTAEFEVLGVDHASLAAWVMAQWNLPASVVAAVAGHHVPEAADDYARLARIVACGNVLSDLQTEPESVDRTLLLAELEQFGLTYSEADELADQIRVRLVALTDLI